MRTSVTRSRKISGFVQENYTEMTVREMADSLETSVSAVNYWLDKWGLGRHVKQATRVPLKKPERDPLLFNVDGIMKGTTWIM